MKNKMKVPKNKMKVPKTLKNLMNNVLKPLRLMTTWVKMMLGKNLKMMAAWPKKSGWSATLKNAMQLSQEGWPWACG
jgi:hypothetical protein